MLSLNLGRIRTAQERFEQRYPPDALSAEPEAFRLPEPVDLAFDIFKDKDQFRLVGHVRTILELGCSRCLEPFRIPVDSAFNLRYHPREANTGEGEREIEENNLSTAFYDDDTIDLGQLMREQFYLVLPMKPLCGDQCRGLCPHCGANLSRAVCDCRPDWEDPRFAALRALKATDRRHEH